VTFHTLSSSSFKMMKPQSPRKGIGGLLGCCALVLMVVLSACSGNANSTASQGNKAGQPVSLTVVDSPRGNFTSNFNPLLDPGSTRTGTQGFLYEPLIFTNRYTSKVEPWLASSYDFPTDAKSITFTIRQGVKWSDGQPMTADDVMFSLNILKQFPALDRFNLWTTLVKDIANPDPQTVKITFKEPNSTATWLFGQTYIVPKHIWQSISDPTKYTNDKPVGTGPYLLKSFAPSLYVFSKNPNFWQSGKPEVDELRFPAVVDNSTANLMLSKGQIDWAGIGWDPKLDPGFTGKDSHNHHWFPPTNTVLLYLNLTKAPFNDVNVRKAMSLAINRPALQQKAAPYAAPANPSAILLPPHQDYLASDYQNAQFKQDLTQANKLMAQAGYTKGSDGIYAKDGQKISFKMMVVNGWSDWQSSTQLIASDLKQLGMDAKVDTVADYTPYFSALQVGNFDTAISWTDQGPTPYFPLNDWLSGDHYAPIGKSAQSTNWGRWKDAATDKLLNQYKTSADPTVQKQAIAGLQKIVVDQVPAIPLDYNVGWFEYTTTHATGWPDKDNPYDYGSPFNFPDNEYIVLQLKAAK
jgi:peptide/nickel transport system substrate-binding protein